VDLLSFGYVYILDLLISDESEVIFKISKI